MLAWISELELSDLVADALTVANLILTAVLGWMVYRYTKRANKLSMIKSSVELIHDFDQAVISSPQALAAMESLVPATPPGMTKAQEHLMCIYLNHLELSYRMWKMGYFDRKTLEVFIGDGLRYYRENRAALEYQLNCGYDPGFSKMMLNVYDSRH